MRISDWSSDVCSSDLFGGRLEREQDRGVAGMMGPGGRKDVKPRPVPRRLSLARKIGAKRVARGGDFRPRPPDRAGPHQRGGRLPQSAGAHLLPPRADPARRTEIDVDGYTAPTYPPPPRNQRHTDWHSGGATHDGQVKKRKRR